ncbi:MAG: cation transporter [Bacteroidales bacterium]|nr:cation transporter [Bacteroidales bacterium]
MYSTFYVSKSQCMTCDNKVLKTLGSLQGVFGAEMDRIEGRIVVNHTDEVTREAIAETLDSLGWKEIPQEKTEAGYDEPSIWGCAL